MKIIFYSQDEELRSLAERLLNIDWSFCEQLDELKFEYEQQPEDELWVYFLDFSCSTKLIDQFSKTSFKNADALRIGLIDPEDFKEIRKHQKTKLACHSYLLKPVEISAMEEAIGNYLEAQGFEMEGSGRFRLDIDTHSEIVNLDEDKEDYDTTESRLVLPDGFRENHEALPDESRATYVENQTTQENELMSNEDFDDGNDEVFEAQEFKINDDVKNLVNEHTKVQKQYHFEDDPVCQKIQAKFSKVFGDGLESSLEDELMMNQDNSSELSFDTNDETPIESHDPNQSVSINFSVDDDSAESEMEPDMSKPKNNNSLDLDEDENAEDGLNFDMPSDSSSDSTMTSSSEVELDEVQNTKGADEFDDDELKFESTGENDIEGVLAKNQTADDQTDGGLVFDVDEALDSAPAKSKSSAANIELDDEDEFSLDTFDKPSANEAKADLDFSDEEESKFDLSSGGELPSENDDDGFGDLNFAESSDDEGIDPTVVGSIDTSSFSVNNSTSENLERTISEIVSGPMSTHVAEVEETGEFELDGDLGFSNDEIDALSQKDGSDKTAATIIVDTSSSLKAKTPIEDASGEFDLAAMIDEDASTTDFNVAANEEQAIEEEPSFSVKPQKSESRPVEPKKTQEEYSRPIMSYNDDELLRLQSTIKSLREEREEHLRIISEQKNELKLQVSDALGLKAELDEAKIEISIIKKRHQQDIEEYRYQLSLAEEKKQIFEERCKTFQKEFDRLNQKVRLEFNQVKQREKELESQLELVTMDSEAQVQARDNKILELKRKIDALEFNMENVTIREEKTREDKMKVEDKIAKIMTTLRGSIKILEDDADIDEQLRVRLSDKQEK